MIRDAQQEFRRIRYDIWDINKRFGEIACTSVTLDYLRERVDHYGAELVDSQRQGEQ